MSFGVDVPVLLGGVTVHTTNNRGLTPEELAEMALDKIIYVGNQSHPAVREQANAFRNNIRHILVSYMNQAIVCHNTTVAKRLTDAGYPELTHLLD
ncbi:hypothetical protein EBZ39_07410 [bacterium]|nr:hypothetical protein [bacterium]